MRRAITRASIALFMCGCVIGAGGGCSRRGPSNQQEKEAVAAAEAWLQLIDDAQYEESWDRAAGHFQQSVPKPQWANMVAGVRKPLGSMKSRQVQAAHATNSLPGAPAGEYVVIFFNTSYENKKDAVETVTPMKDHGAWKVSGYYIR